MNKFMLYVSWIGQFLGIFTSGCCITFIHQKGWLPEFIFGAFISITTYILSFYLERYLKNREVEALFYDEE